jgi:phospholysine phosphohistidine inorganic pyrophosphate phosphatase
MRVKAMLLDLEGVLYEGDRPIAGATQAVARLRDMGLELRYLTNTTTRSRAGVAERLEGLGLTLGPETLFTPLAAARRLLMESGARRIRLAAPPSAAEDFEGVELAASGPVDAVVVGDLYKAFDWDLLNELFGLLRDGARLVALHKNRYCRREDAIGLDVGPFVAALEYAADLEAVVVGKPSAAFFQLALDDMGVEAAASVMVGDDIDADIAGAQGAGLTAIQVRTGKYTDADLEHAKVRPDFRIDSIAALPELLGELA